MRTALPIHRARPCLRRNAPARSMSGRRARWSSAPRSRRARGTKHSSWRVEPSRDSAEIAPQRGSVQRLLERARIATEHKPGCVRKTLSPRIDLVRCSSASALGGPCTAGAPDQLAGTLAEEGETSWNTDEAARNLAGAWTDVRQARSHGDSCRAAAQCALERAYGDQRTPRIG